MTYHPQWFDDKAYHSAGPRYPHIRVELSGQDGNAYAILGRIQIAMRRAGVSTAEISQFADEALASDYNHLLQTCMRWVEVY
jgi:hypothetical protein